MQYILNNNELLFLCVLAGAEEIIGVDNPLEDANEDEIAKHWEVVSKNLLERGYLVNDEEGQIHIVEEMEKILSVIAFPDVALVNTISINNDEEIQYLFIKSYLAISMKNNGECIIDTFEEVEDFNTYLIDFYGLAELEESDMKYMVSIASKDFDKALEFAMKGDSPKAGEVVAVEGIPQEELTLMFDALVKDEESIKITAFKNEEEQTIQAMLNISKLNGKAWMVKTKGTEDYERVSIYKSNPKEMINSLFAF
ncbi:hypothetical protein [Alkaliphilus transvaalensis]|uniref:hypothetical protein n=1 Tax=Alkaliphilus transvaalensis TaxID=114628 RepID=UPI00047C241C|nr:hypothetical protein [Alkaliphilus transvaalensis]